jgi:integrase
MKTPKDGKFPVVVSEGGVSAKIRKITQTKNGTEYVTYMVDYILLGKRKQVGRTDFEEAKQVALNACRQIARGNHDSLTLTNDDRAMYLRAVEALPAGVKLDVAIMEYTSAIKDLPDGATLKEAVGFFRRRNPLKIENRAVRQIADEMLAAKRTAKLSEFHLKDLTSRLKRFSESFQIPIGDVTGTMIQAWLDNLDVTARTKQNYLRIIAMLFRFAIRRKHLAKDAFDEIQAVQPPKQKNDEVAIFTADEMSELLAVVRPEMVPWLAIGAFGGLRSEEIHRLDWREINLAERYIEIKASKAKTAARRIVPITDNLAQWLIPFARESGKVIEFVTWWLQIKKTIEVINAKRSPENKFEWKRNGLRHSFCSYRLAVIKNAAQVALEAGNSPQMIFRHYRQVVSEAEAAKWFAIAPVGPAGNVIALSAEQIAAA